MNPTALMQPGDIVLVSLPQTDGGYKLRPALLLKAMPKYNDFLACAISSQLHQSIAGIDVVLNSSDPDYKETGLHASSVVRLTYLAVVSHSRIMGGIGKIKNSLHQDLLQRLSGFILS